MANIFDSLVRYNLGWSEKSRRSLNDAELKSISKAKVTESDYGKSMCFTMVSGGVTYIPMVKDSPLAIDTEVSLKDVQLVTIQRVGDADKIRVDVAESSTEA